MNEQRQQFAVGIVTLLAGAALSAIIIWFGEFQFLFQPHVQYFVEFTTAPGLQPQVPVRRAGIKIGEVRSVEYSEAKSVVIATIVVDSDNELRVGDVPTLERTFLGETSIEIVTAFDMRGKPNRAPLPADHIIVGKSPPDPNQAIEQAADLVPNMNKTLDVVQTTANTWTKVGDNANTVLEANQKRLESAIKETDEAMRMLTQVADSINKTLDPKTQENIRFTADNLRKSTDTLEPALRDGHEAIKKLNEILPRAQTVVDNLEKITTPFTTRSETIAVNLERGSTSLDLVLADMQFISALLRNGDGTIQSLYRDPQLYNNFETASSLIVKELLEFDRILKDVKVFTDKIARHPGELGLQGVITPDKGLKDVAPGSLEKKGFFHRN